MKYKVDLNNYFPNRCSSYDDQQSGFYRLFAALFPVVE